MKPVQDAGCREVPDDAPTAGRRRHAPWLDCSCAGSRAEGYAVDVAGTTEEARWLATENPYDVLIFDVMLPDGDGFTLCQQLRQAGNWTPVLMLTARDSVNDRVRGLDAGADDYLVKPHSFAELAARVRALVRGGAAGSGQPCSKSVVLRLIRRRTR